MSTEYKVTGTIESISDVQTFASGSQKLQFTIANDDGYNGEKKVYAFDFFAGASKLDKIEKFQKFNQVGSEVDVKFNIECREYSGKYYTNLSAWSVFKAEGASAPSSPAPSNDLLDEEPPF